ncbi:flavodoxin [Lacticaseibacillus kribbianus]|uniref:flavodoxin family protein n=1 Tax=Lacticaseibacillus kribbianus TaxID=2926292 RepID=UPI001CD391D4|nr:flavodoxin [Lacticaseibacillus kribbianus]
MSKTLIVYYSWSGHTAALANKIRQLTQADTYEIQVPADTFSTDMYETSDIAKAQLATGELPPLSRPLPELARYDLILVGGPVWSGAPATPVLSFLATADTGPAVLAPFYTHAGTAGDYEAAFRQAAGARPLATGLGLSGSSISDSAPQIQQWLDQL